jgi:hypothetical protein
MKVGQLIEMLEQMPEDAEVMLAQQPSWPFEYSLGDVVMVGPDADNQLDDDDEDDRPDENIVYLVEGSQTRYLPGFACNAVGWR